MKGMLDHIKERFGGKNGAVVIFGESKPRMLGPLAAAEVVPDPVHGLVNHFMFGEGDGEKVKVIHRNNPEMYLFGDGLCILCIGGTNLQIIYNQLRTEFALPRA